MKKNIAVIGLGSFGTTLVHSLVKLKRTVLAIDADREACQQLIDDVEHVVIGDATKLGFLKEVGIADYDQVVVSIGNNLEACILILMNLKELKVHKVTLRVEQAYQVQIMERLGADEIVMPERDSAVSLANRLVNESFLEYYPVAQGFGIIKIKVPSKFHEASLIELDSRNKFDVNIIAIDRGTEFFIPKGNDKVKPDDVLIVIGKTLNLNKFDRFVKVVKE
jgi:trk system potassium uptake protein TrkA